MRFNLASWEKMAAAGRLEWLNKMIGWESGASFLDQSHREVKQHLNENCLTNVQEGLFRKQEQQQWFILVCCVTCVTHLVSQTAFLRYWHCWSLQYAGRVSLELRNRPRSPKSLCGSVVEHRSANPKVWGSIPYGDSEFFLCPTLVTRWKNIFLSFALCSSSEGIMG